MIRISSPPHRRQTRGRWDHIHMPRPGAAKMRQLLMEPLDDTIFFAGEAAIIDHYGTCHGAYKSGRNTAMNMMT